MISRITPTNANAESIAATALGVISAMFGIITVVLGIINTFWGNDPGYGLFLLLLSLTYFLPVKTYFSNITGYTIPFMGVLKIALGIFIIMSALGVGELFDKIDIMMHSF